MSEGSEKNGEPSDRDDDMDARLRRIESALASMHETKSVEQRVQERVQQRVETVPAPAPPMAMPVPPEVFFEAGKALLPGALRAVGNVTNPQNVSKKPGLLSAQSWLLTDLIQDLRIFGVMFFDMRFTPSWSVRIIPLACLVMIVLNYFLLTALPERVFDLVLVILGYKTLAREAIRYRSEISTLPPVT